MHVGRQILSVAPDVLADDTLASMSTVIIATIVATLVVIVILALCTCGERGSVEVTDIKIVGEHNNVQSSPEQPEATTTADDPAELPVLSVSENGGILLTVPNERATASEDAAPTGQEKKTQHISGGSPSVRKLPDLPDPPPDPTIHDTSVEIPTESPVPEGDEVDPYDHLGQLSTRNSDNDPYYDHCEERKTSSVSSKGRKNSSRNSEQLHFASGDVDDDPYATVNEGRGRSYSTNNDEQDPYSLVKGTIDLYSGENDTSDPYSNIKDPYSNIRDPYSSIPEHKVKVVETLESGGGTYATVEDSEDYYSNVAGDILETTNTMSQTLSNNSSLGSSRELPSIPVNNGLNADVQYAVVNKGERNSAMFISRDIDTAGPPEPPRNYQVDEAMSDVNIGQASNGVTIINVNTDTSSGEPPYTKVTARESLASMAARDAFNNRYEAVENLYATVEGGSGDGVITSQEQRDREPGARTSIVSDMYAEINVESGGSYSGSAPAPPSIETLRSVSRHNQEEVLRRSTGDDHYSVVNHKSRCSAPLPTAHLENGILTNGVNGGDMSRNFDRRSQPLENVSSRSFRNSDLKMDPNYQTVRDSIDLNDSEYDPNYESVDEAKSKAVDLVKDSGRQNVWQHQYEEVTLSSDMQETAEVIKQRVLQGHTYEVVTEAKPPTKDVKETKKKKKGKK